MGNILYRDEGIGVYTVRYLQMAFRFTPAIELVDGAALGFTVMNFFDNHGRLLVLDAVSTEAPAGTIYRLPEAELLDLGPSVRPTAHEVDPIELLKTATARGDAPEVVLLGIVPADAMQFTVGLSPELEAAFPRFVDAALAELAASGIQAERTRPLSLDDVIGSLVRHNVRDSGALGQ